jgi:hypothetical protein
MQKTAWRAIPYVLFVPFVSSLQDPDAKQRLAVLPGFGKNPPFGNIVSYGQN